MEGTNQNKEKQKEEQPLWYVLRVTYQREMMAKKIMDEMEIVNFLPTQRVRRRSPQGKMMTVVQPAIHNYIFVHATKKVVEDLKQYKLNYLRYVMETKEGRRCILTVPEYQMKNFIAVAGNDQEQTEFLTDLSTLNFAEGDRVRILGGPFEGVEGVYMRTSNTRSRRVVIQVAGLMAVATTTLPLAMVEKID